MEEVIVDDEEKAATVVVPDYQLSLAIGKEGQNVRLAAKLCGWKIDIKSHTQYFGNQDIEEVYEDEEYENAGSDIQYLDDAESDRGDEFEE